MSETEAVFTVNSRKFDGSIRRSWTARSIGRTSHSIELIGEFEDEIRHMDLGTIRPGTSSREVFFTDRWYNYFIFREPEGTLRNYYLNICMPPEIGERSVDYVDLDLDVIVWPDHEIVVLDREEFEENARVFSYPGHVYDRALETLSDIEKNWRQILSIDTP